MKDSFEQHCEKCGCLLIGNFAKMLCMHCEYEGRIAELEAENKLLKEKPTKTTGSDVPLTMQTDYSFITNTVEQLQSQLSQAVEIIERCREKSCEPAPAQFHGGYYIEMLAQIKTVTEAFLATVQCTADRVPFVDAPCEHTWVK